MKGLLVDLIGVLSPELWLGLGAISKSFNRIG